MSSKRFVMGVSHMNVLNLTRRLEISGLEIYADLMLEQVFFDFMKNTILHGKTATEIRMRYQDTDNGLVLIFEDNGVGIPDAMKSVIFDRNVEGRKGRGLFLVREILEIIGIMIQETGIEGTGARFVMLVPKETYRFVAVANIN